MLKIVTMLLCLVVAVPAWSCAILNAGDHSELGGECTPNELSALLNAFQKQFGSSDSMPQPLIIMNYKFVPEQKPKPHFFKVLDEDIRIRANEIEAWKIEKGYNEKKDIPLEQCETKGFEKEWTACVPGLRENVCNWICAERKWTVRAKWEGRWYDIKVFKTRQKARDWLDRNGQ